MDALHGHGRVVRWVRSPLDGSRSQSAGGVEGDGGFATWHVGVFFWGGAEVAARRVVGFASSRQHNEDAE